MPDAPTTHPLAWRSRPRASEVRAWLMTWLKTRDSDVLPRMIEIARECPLTHSYYDIDSALRFLQRRGRITWRTGTRSANRGHGAIRVNATGRVLKTAGCPFGPDPTDG